MPKRQQAFHDHLSTVDPFGGLASKLVAHSERYIASDLTRADWLTRLAVQLDLGMAMGWWARAEVLQAQDRLDGAREAIRKALDLDPADPNA